MTSTKLCNRDYCSHLMICSILGVDVSEDLDSVEGQKEGFRIYVFGPHNCTSLMTRQTVTKSLP